MRNHHQPGPLGSDCLVSQWTILQLWIGTQRKQAAAAEHKNPNWAPLLRKAGLGRLKNNDLGFDKIKTNVIN